MLHNSTERNDEQAPLYLRLMPIRDAQQKAKEGSQDSMPPYPIDEEKDMLRRSFEIITKNRRSLFAGSDSEKLARFDWICRDTVYRIEVDLCIISIPALAYQRWPQLLTLCLRESIKLAASMNH